jgi:hypothetical protein
VADWGRDTWQAVQDTWQTVQDTWRHQDAPRVTRFGTFHGGDWTNKKVTRVTTHRVTRGTLTSPSDVADTRQMTGGTLTEETRGSMAGDRWRTAGDVAAHVGQSGADTCQVLIGEKRVPRGPLRGSHVAPHCWWFWCRRVG